MSPTVSELVHTLDDEKLDDIGYLQTRVPKAIDRGPRTVAGPAESPPPLSMPQPQYAVPQTQRLLRQQPLAASSAPLTVNSQGNRNNNNNNNNNIIISDSSSNGANATSSTIESTTTTNSSKRTYTTPQPPLSAGSEGQARKPGNKSVVTTSTGINPKPTPSSTAVSDNSHKAATVRPPGILVRKNDATNASPSSSLRKSFSTTAMSSSSNSQPPLQEHQPRMSTSLSNAVLQKQHQQQQQSQAGPSAGTSYTKVTFEDSQKRSEVSPEFQAVIDQNAILREELGLLRRQQEAWHQSKREMDRTKLAMERGQHLVANQLQQLEELLRHYCLIAAGAGRSEEKGKGNAHPTHSRSDPTTASPRKPPSGGDRSPASKRHRSRSVPRFDEEGEHASRYAVPQPRPRFDDYDYDYEDYAARQESTDEEEDGWEEYSSRRLPPPPPVMRHHHHAFPRYPAPAVPLAGPALPPPQLPPLNRKWDARGGSLRRRRSGSMTPFVPRPVPPHYHPLPPLHHAWRDSGYDTAADYAWDERPPSHRSSRYYDEPSDDFDDYPAAQKRYPHDRRSGGRDRRPFPAYGTSM